MRYEGVVYRPPSEARSLIIQATIGCSHNECTFCSMYKSKKFRIRELKEVLEDIRLAKVRYGENIKRVFIADGDALILRNEQLLEIFKEVNNNFKNIERITVYATPKAILRKTKEELLELKKHGLKMVYMGLESGSEEVLKRIKKGVSKEEMIEAALKIKKAGIKISVTAISGIGGKELSNEHAIETGKVLSQMNPDYVGLLTLLIDQDVELSREIEEKKFELLSPKEVLKETKTLIENMNVENTVFRSNHASNYVSLSGTLPEAKQELLDEIEDALLDEEMWKIEAFRRL